MFWLLWKIVKIFLDKKTAEKVIMIGEEVENSLLEYYDHDTLWTFYGGGLDFEPEYKHMYSLPGAPGTASSVLLMVSDLSSVGSEFQACLVMSLSRHWHLVLWFE